LHDEVPGGYPTLLLSEYAKTYTAVHKIHGTAPHAYMGHHTCRSIIVKIDGQSVSIEEEEEEFVILSMFPESGNSVQWTGIIQLCGTVVLLV
jgi:hypothetical protein